MGFQIKPERWFYCMTCEGMSYRFDCCQESWCTGGGCDKCCGDGGRKDAHGEIRVLLEAEPLSELVPDKNSVPWMSDERNEGESYIFLPPNCSPEMRAVWGDWPIKER